jgi:hypothetical protein
VRVTAAFSRLLRLPGVWVRKVRFEPDRVVVEGRGGATPPSVGLPRVRVTRRGLARTGGRWTRSGGISISESGGLRSAVAAGGCGAPSTERAPRTSRSRFQ